jgi:Spy/CpxP family protein refolding chaperone
MRSAIVVIALAIVGAVSWASPAWPGPWSWGSGPGMGLRGAMWGNLSPEQEKQVSAIRIASFKRQEQLRAEIGKKRIELMELAGKTNPDELAVENKRQEIWALQDKARVERRTAGTRMRAILKADQGKQFGAFEPGMAPGYGRGPWWEK